uniref:GOST seven transmembrane domain-containing protein n=1 Tax=Oryza brachyantha TaxID=4533 RepID=J3MMY1_ORYBR
MSMTPSMGRRRLLHVAAAVAVVVVSCAVLCAEASVHEYSGERFASVGNGFVLHGGSEGVYASPSAESFVRFEKVAFRRTPEAASVAEEDGNRTVTVTAVIFEAGDRDAVGGSDVGGERALCCTPAMARQGGARVAGLGAAYLAAAEVLEVGENVGIVSDHSPARRLFFILPVAVLNTVFIYWIFSSLSRTLTKLKARRMTAKLEMYRKFTNSLIITVALSLGWITFEVHFKSTDEHSERWRVAWVIPAVWQLISFALLCAICLLWAPSQNSMRFAYSGEESEEDADHHDDDDVEDTRPLIRPGPLSYVDNWACYVTQDAKIILRTDSGVYAKAGEELKRV